MAGLRVTEASHWSRPAWLVSSRLICVDGVVHYCVANIPGAVPVTSTHALTNATLPYGIRLADAGPVAALASDPGFLAGLNVAAGKVVCGPVAAAQGVEHHPPLEALRGAAIA
jgi:alanine dehydrogenase